MLTVAVWNLKGGTSKSTSALNVGAEIAGSGLKVAVIDLDGQRTLSFGLGMDGSAPTVLDWLEGQGEPLVTNIDNLYLIPGDIGIFQLIPTEDLIGKSLKRLRGFDLCLLDCPPSLGFASVQAVLNSDLVLMPTLYEPASLKGVSEAMGLIRNEQPDLPVAVLRTRRKSRLVLSREADDLLIAGAVDFNYHLLHNTIPENVAIAESIAQQQPVAQYDAKSPGAIAYRSLAKELMKIWGLK
jgi:chromosome partitioning protein